jgi:ribosomal protein S8
VFLIKIEKNTFAIPFRTHINHRFSFLTVPAEKKGIDFSKAVVIYKSSYIDNTRKAIINRQERKVIMKDEVKIINKFSKYVRDYKSLIQKGERRFYYAFSTLQYFHQELGIDNIKTNSKEY